MSSEDQPSFMSSLGLHATHGPHISRSTDSTPWVNPFFVQQSYGVTSRKRVDGKFTSFKKIVVADVYGKKLSDGVSGSLNEPDDVKALHNSNRDQQMKENLLIVPLTSCPRRLAINIALIPDAKFAKPGQYFTNYSNRTISSSKPTTTWALKRVLMAKNHLLEKSKTKPSIAVDKTLRKDVSAVSVENIVATRTRGEKLSEKSNVSITTDSSKKAKSQLFISNLKSTFKRKASAVLRKGNNLISPPPSIKVHNGHSKSTKITTDPSNNDSQVAAIRGMKLCKVVLPHCDVLKTCPACGLKVHPMLIKANAIKFNECCLTLIA